MSLHNKKIHREEELSDDEAFLLKLALGKPVKKHDNNSGVFIAFFIIFIIIIALIAFAFSRGSGGNFFNSSWIWIAGFVFLIIILIAVFASRQDN